MKLPPKSDGRQPGNEPKGLGREYWKSIEERAGAPELQAALEREFPVGAAELSDGIGRRSFIRLLGASLAASGLGACPRAPPEKILPYGRQPPTLTPGNPVHFATALPVDGYAAGLLVTSWEGRPTKVEGNPQHPSNLGASGIIDQASILQLYDPQRARLVKYRGVPKALKTFLSDLTRRAGQMQQNGGAGLRFLFEPTGSPTLAAFRSRIQARFPRSRFYSYGALSEENIYRGAQIAFGRPLELLPDFEKASVIVSLEADFLECRGAHLRDVRGFSRRRDPGPTMNRLYLAESTLSITGMMADHRLRLRPSQIEGLTMALVAQLARAQSISSLSTLASVAESRAGKSDAPWVKAVAADLARHRGDSIVLAGPRQPPLVHALALAINAALGNLGSTLQLIAPPLLDVRSGTSELNELSEEIKAGTVDTLVITAYNPVYSAPADVLFAQRLSSVPNSVYLGLYEDETTEKVGWMIPAAHPLESWGDARARDGTVSITQPLIDPLFNGITEVEVLAPFLDERDRTPYELVKSAWRRTARVPDFESNWESWLGSGVIPGTASTQVVAPILWDSVIAAARSAAPPSPSKDSLELAFIRDYKVGDGRFANNAWLQELPDPVTKLTWDNAALLSPATAHRLQLERGDLVRLEYRGQNLVAPVFILPGHADDVVSVSLGYGRLGTESIARGVGFNACSLRHSEHPWFDQGLRLEKIGGRHKLAITHDHWSMAGRPLAMEMTLAEVGKAPSPLEHLRGPVETLYRPVDYDAAPYRWAMAIDLNRCTGCSACVVACQSENNIPVVGKENVLWSREMHWLRIDRYFSGSLEDPGVITQPVACVHCEKAPCEYVCPVNATVHSDEGLNEMVYNRCVGTRYCSNNCPYKVRRFNYLHYTDHKPPTERMAMNPDVTVRARGVMEKCSYCVQRIERVRIQAQIEHRKINESELRTACQQACPAQAIQFGSLNDPNSIVSKQHRDSRRYDLLHELGTQPRTAYLARIKNLNPELG